MEKSEAIEELRKVIKNYGNIYADLAETNTFSNYKYSIYSSGSGIACDPSFTVTAKVYIGCEEWTVEIWASELNSNSISRLGSVTAGSRQFLNVELNLPSKELKELKQEFQHLFKSNPAGISLYIQECEENENGDFSLSQLTLEY